mmetsp:Transcript_5152/g.10034  ORF Transcript_5152/g.10034 Transcript_5152/m.10034 type:complete len:220 (-) Transcript_5152:2-661(-)
MSLNLTFHSLSETLSHVAVRTPLKAPFARLTMFTYSPSCSSTFCTTSPTNGPIFPAEDPSFVVYSSFHDPEISGDDVSLRVGFAASSSCSSSAISSRRAGEASTPLLVPLDFSRMAVFSDSTSADDLGCRKGNTSPSENAFPRSCCRCRLIRFALSVGDDDREETPERPPPNGRVQDEDWTRKGVRRTVTRATRACVISGYSRLSWLFCGARESDHSFT